MPEERIITFGEAVREALAEEMTRDSRVFMMGEDIGNHGSVFKILEGLLDQFGPDRVRDTPISEAGFAGSGVGAALAGTAIEHSMLGAAHSAANPLTAHFDVVHGQAVGNMLPAVVRFNGKDPSVERQYEELVNVGRLTSDVVADAGEILAECAGFDHFV